MSFFSNGFAVMLNNRRLKAAKAAKKPSKTDHNESSDKEDKKDKGRWEMLTDAYGRTYWQHSVTGEWSYGFGGALVSPIGTFNPSPIGYPAGAVFTPSPVPGSALYPFAVAASATKVKKKDEHKQGKGWWEKRYDEDGHRYWEHTVTKKRTSKDPYY